MPIVKTTAAYFSLDTGLQIIMGKGDVKSKVGMNVQGLAAMSFRSFERNEDEAEVVLCFTDLKSLRANITALEKLELEFEQFLSKPENRR